MARRSVWTPLALEDVELRGDLERRARANWSRLQHQAYLAPGIFVNVDSDDWPGDWVGRTLHANVLLARTLGEDLTGASHIIRGLRDEMNDRGYFGPEIDETALNEQQLGSPHSWLLRGLIQYHRLTGDEECGDLVERIVREIMLPMRGWWASYPITLAERGQAAGGMVGLATWQWGNWVMSSDIGNQFMLLDGMSEALERGASTELLASFEEGFSRFMQTDLLETNVQTHATLTTLRGILRAYRTTGDERYLSAVVERYALYRSTGMTETYANNNWFGRPDTWTEPCAIIDSFILAVQLWQVLDEPRYLEDAHLIWYNGVARGQRGNGGFGCDSCAGYGSELIRMRDFYEAFFCCTQRGGEGHATAAASIHHVEGDTIAVTFPSDSTANLSLDSGTVRIGLETDYPLGGHIRLDVVDSSFEGHAELRFFTPSWIDAPTASINGESTELTLSGGFALLDTVLHTGDRIEFDARVVTWSRGPINAATIAGHEVLHWGPLVLVHRGSESVTIPSGASIDLDSDGSFLVGGTDIRLSLLGDAIEYPPGREVIRSYEQGDYKGWSAELIAEVDGLPRQVMFPRSVE